MAVAAGSVALPTLLKLADVLAAQKQDLSIGHQLPVEVELGKVREHVLTIGPKTWLCRTHHLALRSGADAAG